MTRVAVGIYFTADYAHYLPDWFKSVKALRRQPDDIVAVTDAKVPKGIRRVDPPGPYSWASWRNALADACRDSDYLVSVDVDDRYLPDALDGCEDWLTDVVAYGLRYVDADGKTRKWLPEAPRDEVAKGLSNLVPEGSPIRTSLFERVRWDDDYMPFADWAFWVHAARAGASFSTTGRIDYDYRFHGDSPTTDERVAAMLAAW